MYNNNEKCGQDWPTQYAPARILWHRYSILFPELTRDRDETYRRCEFLTLTFDLETGAQCSTCRGVAYLPANFGDTTTMDVYINAIIQTSMLRLFVVYLWAIGHGRASMAGARRHRYRSIDYSIKCYCLDSPHWHITFFRRQNSRFRKRFSKIWLSYNVAVPR